MNWFAIVGSFALGLVVAWLVRRSLDGVKNVGVKAVGSLLSLIFGSAVIAFLGHFLAPNEVFPKEYWLYPIGFLVGLIFYPLLALFEKELESPEQCPKCGAPLIPINED
jgi:undecaprenyl pyrophosphate phosphatase UppP